MRSDWASLESMDIILAAMMPTNRLVLEVCLQTGLRVSDVLSMRTGELQQRMSVRESKTGKKKRVYLPKELLARMRAQAGREWVFENCRSPQRHRVRGTVYQDVVKVAKFFRVKGRITPHTTRKMYAVDIMRRTGDLEAVARALNHNERGREVTMLYAMADVLTERRLNGKGRG